MLQDVPYDEPKKSGINAQCAKCQKVMDQDDLRNHNCRSGEENVPSVEGIVDFFPYKKFRSFIVIM